MVQVRHPTTRRGALETPRLEIVRYVISFTPAAIGTAETKALISVFKGDMILSVSAEKVVLASAASTSTISVGDGSGSGLVRFIPVTDTETGTAPEIVQPTASNLPYIYPADDTVDIDYIASGTPGTVNPQWLVTIVLVPKDMRGHRTGESTGGNQ